MARPDFFRQQRVPAGHLQSLLDMLRGSHVAGKAAMRRLVHQGASTQDAKAFARNLHHLLRAADDVEGMLATADGRGMVAMPAAELTVLQEVLVNMAGQFYEQLGLPSSWAHGQQQARCSGDVDGRHVPSVCMPLRSACPGTADRLAPWHAGTRAGQRWHT
jgi:hypothetical protein